MTPRPRLIGPDDDAAAPLGAPDPELVLRLYVCGDSAPSIRAQSRLAAIVDALGGADVEVIDLLIDPEAAEALHILATPLLVRVAPGPHHRIVGDLSNTGAIIELLSSPGFLQEDL